MSSEARLVVAESYPSYVLHARRLAAGEELRVGGFSDPKPTMLCGRTLTGGWDTRIPVKALHRLESEGARQFVCKHCAKLVAHEVER